MQPRGAGVGEVQPLLAVQGKAACAALPWWWMHAWDSCRVPWSLLCHVPCPKGRQG